MLKRHYQFPLCLNTCFGRQIGMLSMNLSIGLFVLVYIQIKQVLYKIQMEEADASLEHACRFISQHVFSFDASNKYQLLKDQINNGLVTNQRLEGLEQIQHYFKRYSYPTTKELLCAKKIPVEGKQHDVYTCTNCAEENNSIFCLQCFDISLHEGHNYELQQAESGICDCGDKFKWKEETFCNKHTYDLHQKEDCPEWASQYKELTAYLIKLLCWIYQPVLRVQSDSILNDSQCKNQAINLSEKIKRIVDQLGSFIIQQLILVNKNRITISQLTRQVLNQEAVYLDNFPFSCKWEGKQQEKVPLIKMMLNFIQLPQTSSKCVELLMLLIFKSDQTHERLTVDYINRYTKSGDFARSSYRQFSPQLLSNSLMMSNINGPLFIIRETVDYNYCDLQSIKSNVEQSYQYIDRYLSDLSYLINLREECANIFWDHFCQNRGFTEIANFMNMFNDERALNEVNQKYYKIEQRLLLKFITIINKHLSEHSLHLLIFQLFQKIKDQNIRMPNDYFFTYQRMWALSVYLYLLRFNIDKNFNMIDEKQMIQLCRCLKIQGTQQSLQTLQLILQSLLKRLFKYFIKIDVFLYDFQEDSNVQDTYFESSNLLPSIDCIFFKIILKLVNYIQKKQGKQQQQGMVPYRLVVQEINSQLSKLDKEIKDITEQNGGSYIYKGSRLSLKLSQLIYFICHIQECIFSDLPDLVLSCKFQDIHSRHLYQYIYKDFYVNMLKTVKKSSTITIQNFRKLAKYFLFQECEVIEQIIDKYKSSETTLQNMNCDGKRINFSFIHSLKVKVQNQEAKQLIQITQLNSEPYFSKPKEAQLLDYTDSHKILKYWMNFNGKKYSRESSETQCQSFQSLPSCPINEMVKTLWTIDRFSRNTNFRQNFSQCNFHSSIYIKHIEYYLRKEIPKRFDDVSSQSSQMSKDESWSFIHNEHQKEQERISANQQQSSICMQESISASIQQNYSFLQNIEIEVKTPVCIICNEEASINTQLFQLCYVSQAKILSFYDLYPNQSNLYFTSCQHFCHKTCISYYQDNLCPQCDKKYNCLLYLEQNLNLTNVSEIIVDQIKQSFGDIRKCVLSLGPCIEVRLFNSLLMFLLHLISVPDRQLLLRTNIIAYRNIYHVLKKYLSKQQKADLILFKQNIKKDKLKGNLRSCYENFLSSASQLLTIKLFNKEVNSEALQIKDKQLVFEFFNNMNEPKLVFSNLDKEQTQGIFSLLPLQLNLQELQQNRRGSCKCQDQQQNNVFYVCLLHKNEVKFCRKCYLHKMKQHINKCHENEAIAVRTDTGDICYFRNDGEMKQLTLQPIYTNKLMQGFVPGKQKNKKLYTLNQTIYRQIATKFISQMFKSQL